MKTDSSLFTRRQLLAGGLASVGGLLLPGCGKSLPPTYGNLLRMADALTYGAHRALLPGQSLAKEYTRREISSFPANGPYFFDEATSKSAEAFRRLRSEGFAGWRLSVEGSVLRPQSFSLEDLKRFPSQTQITKLVCEEGWSAIAEWTGVSLRRVLEVAGIRPTARFVQFYAMDDVADGLDLLEALHPQTLLTYGMNGRDLPPAHGAPLRVRVAKQLGYKSVKFLARIVVTDEFDDLGKLGPLGAGFSWYAGI